MILPSFCLFPALRKERKKKNLIYVMILQLPEMLSIITNTHVRGNCRRECMCKCLPKQSFEFVFTNPFRRNL